MEIRPARPFIEHILIVEDDKGRKEILLKNPTYAIGRGKECDVRLYSQFVSRYHATLFRCLREDGYIYYQIVDGDLQGKLSANGLMLNGRKAAFHNLRHGDQIVFGPQVIAVYQHAQRDLFPSIPPDDPFDITLIDPAMAESED